MAPAVEMLPGLSFSWELTGIFDATADLGTGPVQSAGNYDGFLVRLDERPLERDPTGSFSESCWEGSTCGPSWASSGPWASYRCTACRRRLQSVGI